MKNRPNPFLRPAALAASIFFGLVASSQGQTTYFWDGGASDIAGNGNGASNPTANGTWNTTIKNWESGATPYVAWSNSSLDTAVFAGTARTVTLGTVSVGTLNVRTNTYIFGTAVNSGSMTFSNGFIDIGGPSANTVNGASIRSNLIGSLTVNSSNNTQAGGVALATISGTNTGLTSFTLNLNNADSSVYIDTNVAALGAAGATVKLTKGILVLNANSSLSYNAWTTEFAGGVLRSRGNNALNAATYNGNGTLTENSAIASLTTNNLTYAGTMDLGNTGKTLTVAPGLNGFIEFTNTISNTGNLTINSNAAGVGTGTVRLSAANTFSGTAATTLNLGTLALNHVNALQNATLDTGVSGSQSVTFTAGGTNTYNIGALQGSDALAIGGNTISVGTKVADTIFAADISGASGGLTKVGANKLTLTAGTSYNGATQITGGTLALSGSGTLNGSSGITINGGSAKLLHTGGTAVSTVVTLTNGTLTGSGTINTVNVGAATGGLISNNDGTSGAALTIGALTLTGGANINLYSNTTATALNVTSFTNDSSSNAVTLTANNVGGWTNGSTYNLIDYGTLGGTGGYNFNKVVNNKSARQSETWANDTVNGIITLAFTGDNPRWVGDADGKWNLAAANNWKLVTGGGYTTFLGTDDVLFDDHATGTSNIDIDAANVAPNSTIFDNTIAKSFTLGSTGGFGISTGNLTKNNTGSVTIGSNNTYSGPTTLNAGTVTLSGSGTIGSGSALAMNGGQLDLGNASRDAGTVSITGPAASGDTLLNGSLTGTSYAVSNTSGNVGISANLLANGAAGFTKSGAGSTTLSGTNTWTGTTAINAGSVVLSGSGTLGNGAAVTLGGGSLDMGALIRTVGAVSVTSAAASGDTISNGSLTGTSYAASNTSGNAIISANLLANGAAGFSMSGAGGTATLSGANTYTGTTTISAGTVKAGTASAFNNTGALSMSGSGTFDLGGNNVSFTNITASAGTNSITTTGAGSGTDTLTVSAFGVDGNGALFTDNGTRKLQVSLSSGGVGSWQATTNVNNTYSGGLVLGGSMRASVLAGTVGSPGAIASGAFGKGSITLNDTSQIWFAVSSRTLVNDVIINGNTGNGNRAGSFRIGTNSAALSGLVISGNINANLADAHFGSDSTADGSALLLSGKLTGNSGFRFFQSANSFKWTATLNNATGSPNDYVGATTINSAQTTLALGAADQIPNGAGKGNVVLTSGTLDLAGFSETINGLSGAGTVDNVTSGTTNLLTLGDNDATGNVFSGSIKNTVGTLSLTKTGTGTQTLSGANAYSGATLISAGTLQIGNGAGTGTLSASSSITNNGTLAFNRTGTITQGTDFAAGITGAGGLSTSGTGTLILSGTNGYTGATAISSGELRLASATAINGTSGITVNSGRLSLNGGITVGSGKSLTVNGSGGNFFGALQGNSGANIWQGNILIGATAGTRIGVNADSLKIEGEISGSTALNGVIFRPNAGTTLELAGANTYLGDTSIFTGTGEVKLSGGADRLPTATKLIFGSGAVSGILNLNGQNQEIAGLSVGGGTTNEIKSATAATLTVNATTASSYAGTITGAAALSKSGGETLTLSNINTYSGDTTIAAGSLALSEGGSINDSAVIDVQSAATLSIAGVTTSTTIGGSSAQTLKGLGSIDLGAKTMTIGSSGTLAPGASPGTLDFAATVGASLNFAAGSTIAFELGTTSDLIAFDSAGDWLSGSGNATLSLNLLGGFNYASAYTVFQNVTTTGFTLANITGYDTVAYSANFVQSGNDYALSFTAIPEPNVAALLGGLGSLLLMRRRRMA